MKRTAPLVCMAVAFLLVGCTDLGLSGNVPAEAARTMAPPELVAQVTPPAPDTAAGLVLDGRLWVPAGRPFATTATTELRPIGSAAGRTIHARSWDEPPYSAIFARAETPSPAEAGSAREAMAFGREHWQEYAPAIGRTGQAASLDRLRRDPTGGAPSTVGGDRSGSPEQDR